MSEKILKFLKTHELISVHALEKKCGLPQSTIYKAQNGRALPEKYHESLIKELKRYGFKANEPRPCNCIYKGKEHLCEWCNPD